MKWAAVVLALMLVAGACSNDSGSKSKPKGGDGDAPATAGGAMFSDDVLNKAVHDGTPKPGGTITFGTESDILDIAPWRKMIQPADVQLGSAVYASLIDFGDDNLPVRDNTDHRTNQLAEKLVASDDLATWTLTLRDDIKFSNGKDVTVEDVEAQTNYVKDNAGECSCESDANNIDSVEVDEAARTVTYKLKEPNVAFDGALNRSGLGWIVDWEALGDGNVANPTTDMLVGAGAFQFESQSNDTYTLAKNEHYFGIDVDNDDAELPYLDKLVFRPLSDSVTRLQAVQSGGVQIMQTADTSNLEGAKNDDNLRIQPSEGSSSTILVLNLTHEPFGVDPEEGEKLQDTADRGLVDANALKARQAFNLSIDRNEINQKYYKGTRSPAYGFIPKAMTEWYDDSPEAQLPRTDVAEAKKLLDELKAEGRSTDIEALCINTPESTGIFQILKEQADNVGVEAKLNQVEQAKLLEILLGGEGDETWDVACFRSPQIWDPNSVNGALTTGGATNLAKYSRESVDVALEEARSTGDQAKRKELYDQIQVQVAKDVVYVPLLFDLYANVFTKDVSGLSTPSPASLGIIQPDTLYYVAD